MRLDLPDDSGWFDLLDVAGLNAGHQDDYWDLQDELRERRRAELPPAGPDPKNPAMMLPEPAVRLKRADIARVHDLVASWVVTATSFPGVLPWGPGSRAAMPLPAWNALRSEMEKDGLHFDALNGVAAPKRDRSSTENSVTSSPDAGEPQPESERET